MLICMGVYSLNNNVFDVWLTLVIGAVGYVMKLFRFEPAPLLLGFVLGPLMEENLRRAMLLSRGDPMVFLERPISATLLSVTAGILVYAFYSAMRNHRRAKITATKVQKEGSNK